CHRDYGRPPQGESGQQSAATDGDCAGIATPPARAPARRCPNHALKSTDSTVVKPILLGFLRLSVRVFGSKIHDARTGEILGRALLVPWRGRILFIGNTGAVEPVFLTQERLTYWKQELGFARKSAVDFPREPAA